MYPFPTDRSVSELLGDALAELSKLIQAEFAIARLEMSDKLSAMLGAVKLIGAGAAIALASLVIILMAVAAALIRAGLPDWAGYLCTGVVAAIIGFGLILAGVNRLSSRSLTPSTTLDELRRDQIAAKALME